MRFWLVIFAGITLSCRVEIEGDDANECRDGADNDRDGYFDCQDNGCWNSPDCAGDSGDTSGGDSGDTADTGDTGDTAGDTGDTAGDTGDTGASPAAVLKSVTVAMNVDFDFDDAFCNDVFKLCDCSADYAGAGSQIAADGLQVTHQGTWELADTDCTNDLPSAIWTDPSGDAYLTFVVGDGLATLERFVAHQRQADTEPFPSGARDKGQYWIDEMGATLNDGVRVHYVEVQNQKLDGLVDLQLTTTMDVTFAR